ncbi:HWE histidine kinase domain-containing protein [Microvirga sp. 2YAF29]|uniref:HWE histidine kinase domain-containing protein n=1 Tax=Microvirga sp. 2YAF29 TaxID=3233031 RepID=UPI003F95F531
MAEDITAVARIAELEADNRRLRHLLDQRDAPGELRHRLRNTVAMLRTIIRRSAATNRDLDAYVGHLEDRLDTLVRIQATADARGFVELHTLLSDELFHYGASEGDRVLLSGPDVNLQPKAGQILALAVHELAVNAIEHGALGSSTGRIEISWSISGEAPNASLSLVWKEWDVAAIAEPSRHGFGTEVLTRTLLYELKADTSLTFETDGLRCTIRFPLSERIGTAAES